MNDLLDTVKRLLIMGATYSINKVVDEYEVVVDYKQIHLTTQVNEDQLLNELGMELPS